VRFAMGLFNPNFSTCKAVIADLCESHPAMRSSAFAYVGATFSCANSVASAVGGIMVGCLLNAGLTNPYMFPSLLAAAMLAVLWGGALVYMPETNRQVLHKKREKQEEENSTITIGLELANDSAKEESESRDSIEENTRAAEQQTGLLRGLKAIKSDRMLCLLILAYTLHSFLNGGVLSSIVLMMTLPRDEGGFGMSVLATGLAWSYFGGLGFSFQMLCFRKINDCLGDHGTYMTGCCLMGLGASLFCLPGFVSPLFPEPLRESVFRGLVLVAVTTQSLGLMLGLPVMMSLVSKSTPPEIQGLVQGTAQSMASASRSVGPFICGSLFSIAMKLRRPFLTFVFIGSLYCILICLAVCIKRLHSTRQQGMACLELSIVGDGEGAARVALEQEQSMGDGSTGKAYNQLGQEEVEQEDVGQEEYPIGSGPGSVKTYSKLRQEEQFPKSCSVPHSSE